MGDGTVKYTATVSGYTYTYANSYNMVVQAINGGSIIATKDTTITAYGTNNVKPKASFTITQPLSTNLNYIACTNTTQSNVAYTSLWSFGDSHMSAASNPTWTYGASSSTQTYQVLLSATAEGTGCTDTISHFVTIPGTNVNTNPSCLITYAQTDSCGPGQETFTFTANVSGFTGTPTYTWDYGDGYGGSGSAVTKQYVNPSNYTVILTVNNGSVSCSQIVKANGVNNFPTANFTYTVDVLGNTFTFQDNTTFKSGSLSLFYWDFGDNNIAHIEAPVHTYTKNASVKTYTVFYGIKASNNCLSNVTKTITVPAF